MPRKTSGRGPGKSAAARFNEAAARCRGKLFAEEGQKKTLLRFNEAAARCRGKLLVGRPAGVSLLVLQ